VYSLSFVLLPLYLLVQLGAGKAALSLAGCGTRRQMTSFSGVERIAGGQLARDGEWPWQASIQLDGIHRCGASVISNTWLLTAAHCFRGGTDPRRWTASFGTLLRPPKQKKFVRNIIIHEEYNDHLHNHEYDVAVVELASPIKFTSDVHSICLPEASHVFPDNASCFVTGWGALRNDGKCLLFPCPPTHVLEKPPVSFLFVYFELIRPSLYHGMITPGMLCAGYLEGQVDACQGDSGGPLVNANSRGIWYLVGIVSWGDECGKRNKPGVYTRVTYYRDWILINSFLLPVSLKGCACYVMFAPLAPTLSLLVVPWGKYGFEEGLTISLAP
uniref:Peptidase S1 domain-containing protein n=1 Tax=Dromaius novaehollandiae TaxID=8790 RepID=A0A8C4KH53_DRONO